MHTEHRGGGALREHGAAYQRLCEALERGEGVGGCVMAIEAGLTEAFGRNGELPSQTRERELIAKMKQKQEEEAIAASVASSSSGASSSSPRGAAAAVSSGVDLNERQVQIARRLEEIKQQLEREENTWTGS